MGKKFVFVAVFFCATSMAASFWDVARRSIDETWQGLWQCGLTRTNPYDPRLPRPMVPAKEAVTNSTWRLLAYYDEEWTGYSTTLLFKNPDGGLRHSVSFNDREIQFVTPYAGIVASAKEYMTSTGPVVQYRCRSQPVTEYDFRNCVYFNFNRVITDQLCRFPLKEESTLQ